MNALAPQTTTESHNALLLEIKDTLTRLARRDDGLWDAQDIADYLRMSKSTVQGSVITKKTFPRAIQLETGGRRWKTGEVKAWATRHREN